ncbi:hypothetical protein CR513_42353, partial [Mucuna pruriens]
MTRFLHGLNRKIQDVLRRRSTSRRSIVSSSNWRGRDREKEKVRSDKSIKKGSEPFQSQKEIVVTPSPSTLRTSNIKCFKFLGKAHLAFQCPNRRAIIVRDDGEVGSDSSHRETSSSSESESCSDNSYVKGDLLMVRRLMGSKMVDEVET